MKNSLVSIDLAKNVFQVCAMDDDQKIVFNKKVSRKKLLHTLSQFEPITVIMEACYTSHPWGRAIQALGHTVKLIPPYQVKPFVVGNKSDHNDVIAIAEASRRPKASFVPVNSLEQQDLQSLQRIRERLIKYRSATGNQLRGLLTEYGIVLTKGLRYLRAQVPLVLVDVEQPLTVVVRNFINHLHRELVGHDKQIGEIEKDLPALIEQSKDADSWRTNGIELVWIQDG
jgi:transposase